MSSFSRLLGRRAAMLAGSLGLTLACVLIAEGSSRYAALPEGVLAESRGTNQDRFEGAFPCAPLSALPPCQAPGANCLTCEKSGYTDIGSVVGGGNDPGVPNQGDCGNMANGICDTYLFCIEIAGGKTEQPCIKPPGPLQKQNPN